MLALSSCSWVCSTTSVPATSSPSPVLQQPSAMMIPGQVSVVLHRLVASLCLRVKASKILSVQTSSRLGLCSIVNLSRALHHLTIIITSTMEPHLEQMTLTMAWLEKQ